MAPAWQGLRGRRSRIPKMAALLAAGMLVAASAVAISTTAATAATGPSLEVAQTQCANALGSDGSGTATATAAVAGTYSIVWDGVPGHQIDFTLAAGETKTVPISGMAAGDYSVELVIANGDGGGPVLPGVNLHIDTCAQTPATPQFIDECVDGQVTHAYVIPEDTYFRYGDNFGIETPGRYPANAGQTITIFAVGTSPVTPGATSRWSHSYTATCGSAAPPAAVLSKAAVSAGTPVTISVTGAHAGESLTFTLHSVVVQLGTATADQNGSTSLIATIPADVPAGDHTVMVDGEWTHLEQPLTVTAASTTPTTPTEPNGTDTPASGQSQPPTPGGHTIPATVQTDGDSAPVLWLTVSVLTMALTTAGGAGLAWRRVRRG